MFAFLLRIAPWFPENAWNKIYRTIIPLIPASRAIGQTCALPYIQFW